MAKDEKPLSLTLDTAFFERSPMVCVDRKGSVIVTLSDEQVQMIVSQILDALKARNGGEDAAKVQPMPMGNGIDVAVEVAKDLRAMGFENIAEDIEARIRLGEKKYRTRLKAHNGRDAMLDLYQEILDGINYARQLVIEDKDDDTFFRCLVDLAVLVKGKLDSPVKE
jgi:hypothetical protein